LTPAGQGRQRWAWLVGLVVTVALLAWVLHDVDLSLVLGHARRADPLALAVVVLTATLTFPIRAVRWRLMLRDDQGGGLPFVPLWHATAVGFMANNLLPLRAGEVARAFVASRLLPVRFSTALASIAVERVLDGLVLVALMALAIAAPSFPRAASIEGVPIGRLATGIAVLFSAALIVALVVAHRATPPFTRLDRVLHRLLPQRLAARGTQVLSGLIGGLAVLRSPGRFWLVVIWSIVLWLVGGASFAVCYRAFGIAVPWESALLLQGVIAFGVAIPSSPGFWGVFEAAIRVTLSAYAIAPAAAVSYAVTYHLATFVPITLLGLYSLSRSHLHLRELTRAKEPAA
jgi:uncharacterized protein (TIRG00374 family)